MFEGNKISLVIPAYNEEGAIASMLSCLPSAVDEVIVVDNNSTDNTKSICERFPVLVVSEEKKGYGFAYKTGIPIATGDIIITMDGDNTYPLSEIDALLAYFLKSKCEFLSGCRVHKNAMPLLNKIGNVLISFFIRGLFKINLKDSQSGMWVFKKSIFSKILPKDSGMGFSQEIKIRAWRNQDIKCREFDINYAIRKNGSSKFKRLSDSLLVMRNLLSLAREINVTL